MEKKCLHCRKSYNNDRKYSKFCSRVCFSLSQIWKNKPPHTEEWKKQNSILHKWKKVRLETKEKLSQCKIGDKNPMYGKTNKYLSEMSKKQVWEKSPSWKWWMPKCIDCWKQVSSYHTTRCKWCASRYNRWENNASWKWWVSKINKTERQLAMNTKEYKLWRYSVFERDNYTCIWCFKRWCVLHADHIKPWCDYPELRYAIDNWRTLCVDCHKKTGTWWRPSTEKTP